MSESLRWHGIRIFTALIAALAVASLGVRADLAWADEPGGEDIVVPPPAPVEPPPAPPADDDKFHLYLSGNLGGSFAKGRSGGSINWGGPIGISPNTGNGQDEDVFGGGALGIAYDGDPIGVRFEMEGQAARGYDLTTDSAFGIATLSTSVNTWAMFWNTWLDVPITESWSIFGGGGIGFSVTDMTTHPAGIPIGDKSRNDDNFAWQVGGGFSVAATDWLFIDTSYRFVDLGDPDLIIRLAPPPSDLEMKLQSHDLMLGVRMNFFSF